MSFSDLDLIWFIFAVVLMALELLLPGGIVFFLGLGAMSVSLLLYIGVIDGWVQAFTAWFASSLIFIFSLRGVVQKIIPATVERGNTDEDLDAYDKTADVIERIPAGGRGRIRFKGSTWQAQNYHARGGDLEAGETVRIVYRDNLVWLVEACAPASGTQDTDTNQPNTQEPGTTEIDNTEK